MNKAKMLTAIAQATGLKRETIKDLMKNGWYYEEHPAQGERRFTQPASLWRR
jgi:hypothetical protein